MSNLEWLGIVLTIIAIAYFLSVNGVTGKSIALTLVMLVFGFMAGNMLYSLWFR